MMKVNLSGLPGIEQLFRKLEPEILEAAEEVLGAEQTRILRAARGTMPKDTGALAGSGDTSRELFKDGVLFRVNFGGQEAPYAPYLKGAKASLVKSMRKRRGGIRSHLKNKVAQLLRKHSAPPG